MLAGISVVLPAWNEEGNVGRAVKAVTAAAGYWTDATEVVVVDDGSSDQTAAEAAEAGARVVSHGCNLGYGAALRTGFAAASLPWTWLMDADNQFEPSEIGRLVPHAAAGADLVLGYRSQRAEGLRRAAAARAWAGVVRALVGPLAIDIDCAFKLMRTDLVQQLPLGSSGATISAELLARARRRGADIVEVPVSHLPRTVGSASGLQPAVVARAFLELCRLRRAL
jgi:glycosyltransferase involved in cell wall biosynthesis